MVSDICRSMLVKGANIDRKPFFLCPLPCSYNNNHVPFDDFDRCSCCVDWLRNSGVCCAQPHLEGYKLQASP